MACTLADTALIDWSGRSGSCSRSRRVASGCSSRGSFSMLEVPLIVAGEVRPGWRLIAPLPVTVRADGDGWFVADTDSYAVHGTGRSASEAVADLLICLTEYYGLVEESAKRGNPFDREELRRLRQALQPTMT